MCGIAGIAGSSYETEGLGHVLQRMGESLVHWGPDEQGQLLVHELRTGLVSRHLSIIDLETGQQPISTKPFWRFAFDHSNPARRDEEYAAELQSLLDSAAASRLKADVPIGVMISGGVDSSLVAAAASRLQSGPLKTFSVIFPDAPEVDERPYQQAMVDQLGSEHHEVEFRSDDVPELTQKVLYHQDVPSLSFPSVVLCRLAESVSASVKTVHSGEGADELFAGYAWYSKPPYQGMRRVVPPILARLPATYLTHVKWGRFFRVLAARDETSSMAEVFRVFTPWDKNAVMNSELPLGTQDCSSFRLDLETEASCSDDLQRRIALGFTRRLADGLLMVNDRMSMARSLEVRMPFLDNSIVDFARRLPPDMAHRGSQEKYIFSLMKDQLPQAVARRKKQPLSASDNRYFRGPLREWARDVLLSPFRDRPLSRKVIEKRFEGWLEGSDYSVAKVRVLVAFQLWWNLHFGNNGAFNR